MLKIIVKFLNLAFLINLLILLFAYSGVKSDAALPVVHVLRVDGNIVPIVADYIETGIRQAEAENSSVCLIELDTPGGLLNSTEEIVQTILNAEVPVVVYVSPKGSWAASAGTFITMAAHVAAMAPGTSIGAAHPVTVGEEMPDTVSKKVTEHSSAWIRSIAQMRERNPEQAELAVTESKSFSASEALEADLIDLQADNINDLLSKIDGIQVTLGSGRSEVINTHGYILSSREMNPLQRFLHIISDPNIAYILLSLATIGLITEISNPGLIFPGAAGGISLFLAFYSLGVLNAHWAGILLLLLAFGLFVAEIFTASFGILTAGGVTSLVIGSLILFSRNSPEMEVNRWLIASVALIVSLFIIFVVGAIIRGQRRRVSTGAEGLLGKTAVVKKRLNPSGTVIVDGEHWLATIESGSVETEEEVLVTKVEGLRLIVTKKKIKGRR